MNLHFINVGYGDAILLEGGGPSLLVDGGPPAGAEYGVPPRIRAVDYLRRIGVGKIDVMVATHLHADHLGGLAEVAREMPVRELWCALPLPGKGFRPLSPCGAETEGARNALDSINLFYELCGRVSRVRRIGTERAPVLRRAGLAVECLWPDGEAAAPEDELLEAVGREADPSRRCEPLQKLFALANRCSVVLRLTCGETAALLTADADAAVLEKLAGRPGGIGADLLKLPHHGRADGMSEAAARAIGPAAVVVSVSRGRTDGCPSEAALRCFDSRKTRLFFTDGSDLPRFRAGPSQALVFPLK